MSRSQVVKRFTYVEKVFLLALLGAAWTSILQVLAVHSEEPERQLSWSHDKQYRGVHAAVFSSIGGRTKMEDTFALEENIGNLSVSLYGVFDGHGGDISSKYTAQHLLSKLKKKLQTIYKYTKGANINYISFLTNEIEKFDKELLAELEKDDKGSGTTAVIALMVNRMLYIANVGDSRLVIDDDDAPDDEKATQMTKDHKPLAERKRIEDEGAEIWKVPREEIYRVGKRTFHKGGLITYNGLATSRALGDRYLKGVNCGLIATPEIFTVNLSLSKTNFIILATDGLWDVVTNAEAGGVIRDNLGDELFGAKRLVEVATRKPKFSDNITVMVVKTRPDQEDHNDRDDRDDFQDSVVS